jgi:DUF4097 and DUF4098 domain-containing protein YvlB
MIHVYIDEHYPSILKEGRMKSSPSRYSIYGIVIALSCLLVNCFTFGDMDDRITKTYAVGPGGTLTIESDIGSIDVHGADIDSVEVEILRGVRRTREKRAQQILEDFDIQFHHTGSDVTIEAKYKKKGLRGFWNNVGKYLRVKYIIAVPVEYNVDLFTKGGSITVDNLQGEVLSRTSGGSLNFDNIKGNITGKTSGGSVSIGEVLGQTNVRTSGGSVHIKLAEGPVDAHTSGGSITVEEVVGEIKAHTSGGSVKAYLSRQPEADCSLTTSGGSITVHLSEDIGVDINAKTSGGRVHTDFRVSLSGEISKNAMHGEMNGGGPELYLRTSGGSIYLKNR